MFRNIALLSGLLYAVPTLAWEVGGDETSSDGCGGDEEGEASTTDDDATGDDGGYISARFHNGMGNGRMVVRVYDLETESELFVTRVEEASIYDTSTLPYGELVCKMDNELGGAAHVTMSADANRCRCTSTGDYVTEASCYHTDMLP